MATDESDPTDARLEELERRIAQGRRSRVGSAEELARSEQARAARVFGFLQPTFRTSLRLRFSGDGVLGHDLAGQTAGDVVSGLAATVAAAGGQRKLPPDQVRLFLSPTVAPGSTVLEMFGAAMPTDQKLDTAIDDSPVDTAVELVFDILAQAQEAAKTATDMPPVQGALGQRLFRLAKDLIDDDVDLGITWTRPRGTVREASFDRAVARTLQNLLDREEVTSDVRTEVGKLASISTTNQIRLQFEDGKRRRVVDITTEPAEAERLRSLWATRVEARWTETTTTYPQRDKVEVERLLIHIEPADKALPSAVVGSPAPPDAPAGDE